MRRHDLFVAILLLITSLVYGQDEDVFLGGGSPVPVNVTTSSSHKLYTGNFEATGEKTVNGDGMNAARMEASRFLAQSTLGYDISMVDQVVDMGMEAWIDSQLVTPPSYLSDTIISIYDESKAVYVANGNNPNNFPSQPNHIHMDYSWWQVSVRAEDALRQRVAEALSQIIVVSLNSDLSGLSLGMSTFYDYLIEHALGNYRELLTDVTLSPAMGIYLTFVNNPKSDLDDMTFPDENYARELMQLFVIGLDKLNPDGTPILDGQGNRIPTYDNDDIAEFAKIFTGLSYGARYDQNPVYWGMGMYSADLRVPMIMYENYHEPGEKYLLDGYVVPSGQTGMEDIEEALDHLFNHPNVGPFIATRLIQRLVKSNPTPAYVQSVAAVFGNNGQGERGDLGAVVKAILLHPEARDCAWMEHPEQGRLREPILKFTQFYRLFGAINPVEGRYWNYSYWYQSDTDMHPMRSPSVFNFYAPTFSPNGPISSGGLVAPEFGIYNSRTSIGYANQVHRWIDQERLLQQSYLEDGVSAPADLSILLEYAKDPDALMDYLDIYFTNGQLTDQTRGVIKHTLSGYGLTINQLVSKVSLGTHLVMISPDYNILK